MIKKLCVQVINFNSMKYTIDCVRDLLLQDSKDFDIIVVDQDSKEEGTEIELIRFELAGIDIVRNIPALSLIKQWNRFYAYHKDKYEYLCFLNNDVRIPDNFISDTIRVLDNESSVGAVVHSTNHPAYQKKTDLIYVIKENIMQGWDFTIRSCCYVPIDERLVLYCGDDWLFEWLYTKGYKTAIALSSPIIHFLSKSTDLEFLKSNNPDAEIYPGIKKSIFNKTGTLFPDFEYSNYIPNFDKP